MRRMRVHLGTLLTALCFGGCSLLYNPSNIPDPVDAMPDAEVIVDADPTMLELTSVTPTEVVEGTGDLGSRKAVIVIDGRHMAQNGVVVTIAAAAGETRVPMVMVDDASVVVEGNGERLALAVTLPVDTDLPAGETIDLDITVTQGAITRTLTGKLTLRGLAERTMASPGFATGINEYSRVNITTGQIAAATNATGPIMIHARSSITLGSAVTFALDATATTPGPAGGAGGTGGAGGLLNGSVGMMGAGPAPGLPSGGPGRFDAPIQLTTLDVPNRSSGGAGGDGVSLGSRGGDGGAGGGSISLFAGGTLTVGNITARGAAGETAGVTNPGGGGSGGVILLRAGSTLTAGNLDVTGFPNAGRARVDAGGALTAGGAPYRGPMFMTAPLISTEAQPEITVVGGALIPFRYIILKGANVFGPYDLTMSSNEMKTFTLAEPLDRGLNQVCVLPAEALASTYTRTCIDIVYLYKPPAT